jgi:hypothetical protein
MSLIGGIPGIYVSYPKCQDLELGVKEINNLFESVSVMTGKHWLACP